MPKEISLTKGYVTIVDDNDFDALNAFSWFADENKKTGIVYAARTINFQRGDGVRRNRKVKMHNQILGSNPGFTADHISRDSLDNRRTNLRWSTRSQNNMNRRFKKSVSGFRGVYKAPKTSTKPWMVQIEFGGQRKHLGCFETPQEGAIAYDSAARQFHGKFAQLNFPNN